MRELRDHFGDGPFTTREARDAGVTPNELRGPRFRRLHRGVYILADVDLGFRGRVAAAGLALPADAQLSHASRIRFLGLDCGPSQPLHFTVARDLHVTPAGVFLHRTKVMPPIDDVGVTPAAAFVGLAGDARLLDLMGVGDWMLHRAHMSSGEVRELVARHPWRPGATQAIAALPLLDRRAASIPESHLRGFVVRSGLPEPEVNVPIFDTPDSPIADLLIRKYRLVLEYEGGHHFADRAQLKRDSWRYALMREADIDYIRIYAEMLAHPRALVTHIHSVLVRRGYDGRAPKFGTEWDALFTPSRLSHWRAVA